MPEKHKQRANPLQEVLPSDVEAEASFLASCCAPGGDATYYDVIVSLQPEHFVVPKHQEIFVSLKHLCQERIEVSPFTLKADLEKRGKLDVVEGYFGITEVLQSFEVGRPATLAHILRKKRKQRQLIKLAHGVMQHAQVGDLDPEEIINQSYEALRKIVHDVAEANSSTFITVVEKAQQGLPFVPQEDTGGPKAYTGIHELDSEVKIPNSYPSFILARPGVGKSALAIQIAGTTALRERRVLYVSIELEEEDLETRMAAWVTETSQSVWENGWYRASDVDALNLNADLLDRVVKMFPPQLIPWPNLESLIRQELRRNEDQGRPIDCIIIDDFGYIGRPPVREGSSEAYSFRRVVDQIAAMNKDIGIPVIVLGHLKQDESGKEPNENGAADTDAISRRAGLMLGMWKDNNQEIWCKTLKVRKGSNKFKARLVFNGATCRFKMGVRETGAPQQEK